MDPRVGVEVATARDPALVAAVPGLAVVSVVALLPDLDLLVAAGAGDDLARRRALRILETVVRSPVAGLALVQLAVAALQRLGRAHGGALDARHPVLHGAEVALLRRQSLRRHLLLAVAAHGRLQLAGGVALVTTIALLAGLHDRVAADRCGGRGVGAPFFRIRAAAERRDGDQGASAENRRHGVGNQIPHDCGLLCQM